MSAKFRKPAELLKPRKRVPISARVLEDTYDALVHAANGERTSMSDLVAGILDDYVRWLTETTNKSRKK